MRIDANVEALNTIAEDQMSSANAIANMSNDSADARAVMEYDTPDGMGVRTTDIRDTYTPQDSFAPQDFVGRDVVNDYDVPGLAVGRNFSLEREFVDMIRNQDAFAANTVAITAIDDTTGLIVDARA